jgi:hypothetical protein
MQLIAVQRSGKTWNARHLGHNDLQKARAQVERNDQGSLSFTRLEETSSLLWIETDLRTYPQQPREIVPGRSVRWGMQLVACDAQEVQALVPSPLAGVRLLNKCFLGRCALQGTFA